ncbi:MAG: lysylphosphatidylglycerol synthase transmembrane domain-containing protein [Actinomycetota bacterium]|nr:lysylphosphatidylglycerol synthase transmembrane domain-containing protein [Actinomycetota bacterium]
MSKPDQSAASSLFRWFRVAVALALVGFLAWRAGVGQLSAADFEFRWLAVALLLVPFSILVRAFNHSLLMNRPDHVIGLGGMARLTLVGVGINLFLPMGAADLAKAHYGYRLHGHPERMVLSSVLDKLTSLTAVAFLGVAGSLVAGETSMAFAAAAVAVASLVPFVAPRWMPWRLLLRILAPKAELSEDTLEHAARVPWPLLVAVWTVSVLGWLLTYGIVYLCCLGVGADVAPAYVFALAPLATIVRLVPVSIGGIGLGEVTLAALLIRAGMAQDLAAAAALLQMIVITVVPGAVGVALLAIGKRRDKHA